MRWGAHLVLLVALIGGALLISFFDSRGIRALYTLHSELYRVQHDIAQLSRELDVLEQEKNLFETNRRHQERLVRLRTGYLGEDELMIEWLKH